MDSPKIQSIVFAQNDKAFAVVGTDGYIGRFEMPSFRKIFDSLPDAKTDKWHQYRDISFVHDSRDGKEKPED